MLALTTSSCSQGKTKWLTLAVVCCCLAIVCLDVKQTAALSDQSGQAANENKKNNDHQINVDSHSYMKSYSSDSLKPNKDHNWHYMYDDNVFLDDSLLGKAAVAKVEERQQRSSLHAAIKRAEWNAHQISCWGSNLKCQQRLLPLTDNKATAKGQSNNKAEQTLTGRRRTMGPTMMRRAWYWPFGAQTTTPAPSLVSSWLGASNPAAGQSSPASGGRLADASGQLGALIAYEGVRSYALAYELASSSSTAPVFANTTVASGTQAFNSQPFTAPVSMHQLNVKLLRRLTHSLESLGRTLGAAMERAVGLYSTRVLDMALSARAISQQLASLSDNYAKMSSTLQGLERQVSAGSVRVPVPPALRIDQHLDMGAMLIQLGRDIGALYGTALGSVVRVLPEALTRTEPTNPSLANILSLVGCRMGAYVANYFAPDANNPNDSSSSSSPTSLLNWQQRTNVDHHMTNNVDNDKRQQRLWQRRKVGQIQISRSQQQEREEHEKTSSLSDFINKNHDRKVIDIIQDQDDDDAILRKDPLVRGSMLQVELPTSDEASTNDGGANVRVMVRATLGALVHHVRAVLVDNLRHLVANVSSYTGCKLGSIVMYAVGVYLEPPGVTPIVSSLSALLAFSFPVFGGPSSGASLTSAVSSMLPASLSLGSTWNMASSTADNYVTGAGGDSPHTQSLLASIGSGGGGGRLTSDNEHLAQKKEVDPSSLQTSAIISSVSNKVPQQQQSTAATTGHQINDNDDHDDDHDDYDDDDKRQFALLEAPPAVQVVPPSRNPSTYNLALVSSQPQIVTTAQPVSSWFG